MASLPCPAPDVARPPDVDRLVGVDVPRSVAKELAEVLVTVRQAVSYDWHEDAACRRHARPDIFFPPTMITTTDVAERARILQDIADAQKVCGGCPVRKQCGDHGVDAGEEYGMWGGVPPRMLHKRAKELRSGVRAVAA